MGKERKAWPRRESKKNLANLDEGTVRPAKSHKALGSTKCHEDEEEKGKKAVGGRVLCKGTLSTKGRCDENSFWSRKKDTDAFLKGFRFGDWEERGRIG